jgi:hypothetical protein
LGIKDNDVESNILIYPNLAVETLFINSDNPITKVSIFNILEKKLWQQEGVIEQLDISQLNTGVFFYKNSNRTRFYNS